MKIRKLLALVLALMMVLSIAVAENELSEPGVLPIWQGDEPYTLTVLVAPNDYVDDWENNEYTKWIEQNCNVNLDFVFLPQVEPDQKLAVMIETGETLPDIICRGIGTATVYEYGRAGALINLQEYYEDGTMVNVNKADAEFPAWSVKGNITNFDGSIYAVPKIQASLPNETKYKLWLNKQLMEEVGWTEMPTTTDEFKDLLVAFKEAGYLPLLGSSSWGANPVKYLTNAFLYEGDGDMWMLKDGEVTASYVQDEWFEAVDYLRDLCTNGLLLPESFTYGRPDIIAVAAQSNVLGGLFDSSMGFFASKDTPEYQIRLNYWPCDPLTGPNGFQGVCYAPSATNCQWMVTKDCTNPELAARVGDFIFCEEGFLRGRFGLEGQNWEYVDVYTAAHPETVLYFSEANASTGLDAKYVTATPDGIKDAFSTVNHIMWYDAMPYFSAMAESQFASVMYDEEGNNLVDPETNHGTRQGDETVVMQKLKDNVVPFIVPTLAFSADETKEIGEMRSALTKFVNEQRTLYIRGEESFLDDKDAFLAELETIGLSTVLDYANVAYERQYK